MTMKTLSKVSIIVLTAIIAFAVFFYHQSRWVEPRIGQCCGYEGDPDMLEFFFQLNFGVFYLLALTLIIGLELFIFKRLNRKKEPISR